MSTFLIRALDNGCGRMSGWEPWTLHVQHLDHTAGVADALLSQCEPLRPNAPDCFR